MNLIREVAEKVNRPFEVKLAETKAVIAHHFLEFGDKCAVAFSGGKDSEVVLWLCLQVNPNVTALYNNTGVEYPETVQLVADLADKWNVNLVVTHPMKTYWECVEQYGFPRGKQGGNDRCCDYLKEKPEKLAIRKYGWLGEFDGLTAVESRVRMWSAKKYGVCHHHQSLKICKVHPILWWTPEEVWQFIRANNLPYNPVYDKGADRVGCMPCTAHKYWEAQMQRVNPKLYSIVKLRKDNQYVMSLSNPVSASKDKGE